MNDPGAFNDLGPWIAVASLLISLAVLVFGAFQYRQVARKDYVEELERQLGRLERRTEECEAGRAELSRKVEECERERFRLERMNFDLLAELHGRPGGPEPSAG